MPLVEMCLVWIEMDFKCKIYTEFWKFNIKNIKYLIDYILKDNLDVLD